jgi:hypothetical protein
LIANNVELLANSIAWQPARSATLRRILFIYTVSAYDGDHGFY